MCDSSLLCIVAVYVVIIAVAVTSWERTYAYLCARESNFTYDRDAMLVCWCAKFIRWQKWWWWCGIIAHRPHQNYVVCDMYVFVAETRHRQPTTTTTKSDSNEQNKTKKKDINRRKHIKLIKTAREVEKKYNKQTDSRNCALDIGLYDEVTMTMECFFFLFF